MNNSKMWLVVVSMDFGGNETFIFTDLQQAEKRYKEIREAGQLVYLAEVMKTNI